MPKLPRLWLLSDARNDAALEQVLAHMPRGSGFVFRHYHLGEQARYDRFAALRRIAHWREHRVFLAASPETARAWLADGTYGPPRGPVPLMPHIAAAHNLREIAAANRSRAAAIMLSPVFATRSHPGGAVLGPLRFQMLAACAQMPVIALGGMNRVRARRLRCYGWAAIDGLAAAR